MSKKVSNPTTEGLMNNRTVVLSGRINRESINSVRQKLLTLQIQSPDWINLIIESGGGSIYAALGLCDLMTNIMTAPVRGIALGSCGSAATFVMLHCRERIGTPHAQFLIHSGSANEISIPINETTSEHLEQLLKDVKATEEMVLELYMNRLTPTAWKKKKPSSAVRRTFVQRLISRGDQPFNSHLSASEAVEVGLITKIIHGNLNIFKG